MAIRLWISLVLLAVSPPFARAANPAVWSTGMITTTGGDVFWTSPTAVTTGLASYDWTYEILEVEAELTNGEESGWLDVKGLLSDNGFPLIDGGSNAEIPFVFVNQSLNYSGTSATFLVEVDATGLGKASITNITFGTITIFETTLTITGIRASLELAVTGYPHGDYNRDLHVDQADYELWKSTFDSTTDLAADGNRDNLVDAADYVLWRDNYGQAPTAASSTMVPEPSGFALLSLLATLLLCTRRRMAK